MNARMAPHSHEWSRSMNPAEDDDRVQMASLFGAIRRRVWMIVIGMVVGAILLFAAAGQITPVYTATGQVMLNSRDTRVVTEGEVVPNLQLNDLVINSELSIIQSNVVRDAVVSDLGLQRLAPLLTPEELAVATRADLPRRLSDALANLVSVRREDQSYVLSIAAVTTDPVLSADIVNAVLRAYTEMQLSDRVSTARLSASWLENRTAGLRAQVETAERDVEQYRGERLVEDGGSVEAASQQLTDLNAQLAEARAATRLAVARYDQLSAVIRDGGSAAALDIIQTPLVLNLRGQRSELSREAAEIESRYSGDHPDLRRLQVELAQIDSELEQEVNNTLSAYRNDLEVARRSESATAESLTALEQRILQMSQSAIMLRQLEREAEVLRGTYEELASRLEETRTQVAVQQSDSKIIASALAPHRPSFPRVPLLTALGGVLGASLALALVLISELSRSGFRTAGQLQSGTGLPVFEALSEQRWRSPKAVLAELRKAPHGRFAEQSRKIIQFLNRPGSAPRSIAITSSLADEGKSTLAVALAHTQADLGKSVVLVDCDLRNSSPRKLWQAKPGRDLRGVLVGSCSVSDAIQRDTTLNCDVLCAASQPDGDHFASKLLTPERIAELLSDLKGRYEIIVIDTPPAHLVAETLSIAAAADATLYAVRWERTPRKIVEHNIDALRTMGARVSGFVLTRVSKRALEGAHTYG